MTDAINGPESAGYKPFDLTSNTRSDPFEIEGAWSLFFTNIPSGCTATVQRKPVYAPTWMNAAANSSGDALAFDNSTSAPNCVIDEPAKGVQYAVLPSGTWTGNLTGYFIR